MNKPLGQSLIVIASVASFAVPVGPADAEATEPSGATTPASATTIDGWSVRGQREAPDRFGHAVVERGLWKVSAPAVVFTEGTPRFSGEIRLAGPTSYVVTSKLEWSDDRLVATDATVFSKDWSLAGARVVIVPDEDRLVIEHPGETSLHTRPNLPEEN